MFIVLKYVTLIRHLYHKIIVMDIAIYFKKWRDLYSFQPYNPHSFYIAPTPSTE